MNKTTFTLGISLMFSLTPCQAEITTDGSVGPVQDLAGPNFSVGQNLGTLSGNNLFHSFSHFNLSNGQSATFTGDAAIQNVISRVTGGGVSNIDGLLKSDIGQAAVYFINPAGIVFGQNAKVDVPGAFHASTANELQFADGGKFSANPLAGSSLSMAAPAAFGFLGTQTGTLALNGANLEFKAGHLSASNINLNNAKLIGNNLQLAAVGGEAESLGLNALPDNILAGNLTLTQSGIEATGEGGGWVGIRAGQINLTASSISAQNTGNTDAATGQGIDVLANTLQMGGKSFIYTTTEGQGDAGNVTVKARGIGLNGSSSIQSFTAEKSVGDSGQVAIQADQIQIADKGFILTRTDGAGDAGTISVQASDVVLSGAGSSIQSYAPKTAQGNAGKVNIEANQMHIDNEAGISTQGKVDGNGGVRIKAGSLTVSGKSQILAINTGDTDAQSSEGLDIQADTLNLNNKAELSAYALGDGKAGDVVLKTGNLVLDNGSTIGNFEGYNRTTPGNGGQIWITAGDVRLLNQSILMSGSLAASDSGDITLDANSLLLTSDSLISNQTTGEVKDEAGNITRPASSGNAGNINIQVRDWLSMDGTGLERVSSIQSFAKGTGKPGDIHILAGGDINLGAWANIGGLATTEANAGNIDIQARNLTIDAGDGISSISANTKSGGNAGNVNVSVQDSLRLTNGGDIAAFSLGGRGHGGNVTVNVQNQLHLSAGSEIHTNTTQSSGDAGTVQVNAGSLHIEGWDSGISSDAQTGSTGNAGQVKVTVRDALTLEGSRQGDKFKGGISSTSFAQGNAGTVEVNAGSIRLDASTINSDTQATDSSGNAGNVKVSAQNELVLLNGSQVSSGTWSKGNAGSVEINAGTIRVDNAGISSSAEASSGNAGNVNINARGELAIVNSGAITSSTATKGNAGSVKVNAESISINGQGGQNGSTGIFSTAVKNASGAVGSVSVTAAKSLIMDEGKLSIKSEAATGNPEQLNQLTVTAPAIKLTNNSKIDASASGNVPASAVQIKTDQLTVEGNSQITTSANQGNGGPISINANDWLFLNNSQITTSVTGKDNGNGGDITLNGDVLVMDSGFIQANTAAQKANGGNINLNIKQLVYSQDNLQRGGSTPLTFIPNSGLNVIQAASPTGVNGNINITAPQLNIVGALVGLNNPELDLSRIGHDPCSDTVRQSTLKRSGKGGVPLLNKGQDGYTLEHLLETKPDAAAGPQQAAHTPNAQQDCKPKPAEKPLQQALTY